MGKFNRKFEKVGWNEGNPYYDPGQCGLELIGVAERPPNWDFDMIVAWRDIATGAIFVAHDSGCSCPTPFEEYTSLDKLTRIRKIEDYDKFAEPHGRDTDYGIPKSEIRNLRIKINRFLVALRRKEAVKKQAAAV